jgi:predicted Zn-dependent protease with MMP-like domain
LIRAVKFDEFDRLAREMLQSVPEEYRRGVAGILLHRASHSHPHLPKYFTLGECEPVPFGADGSEWNSRIHLYHGSFRSLARKDPDFDWEEELWETILHEIRHHLEDRAGAGHLADEDAAEEENEKRRRGLPFSPNFYRLGETEDRDEYWVGGDCFLEIPLTTRAWRRLRGKPTTVRWGEEEIEVTVPDGPVEAAHVVIPEGWEDDEGNGGDLVVVFVHAKALPFTWTRTPKGTAR